MLKLLSQCAICHQAESILCNQCQRHLNIYDWKLDLSDMWNLDWIVIGRHYDHIIRHLVHRLKYGRGKAIAKILWIKLATLISTTNLMDLIQLYPWQVVITAVPTHRVKQYFTRWYNQAELLAKSVASSLELPYSQLLYKSRRTTSQVKISRTDRIKNVLNSFDTKHISPSVKEESKGNLDKIIILIDDIITTGATIHECARILHNHYPHSQIWWVCIARNR